MRTNWKIVHPRLVIACIMWGVFVGLVPSRVIEVRTMGITLGMAEVLIFLAIGMTATIVTTLSFVLIKEG